MSTLEKGFYGDERKKIAEQVTKARKSERLNNEESYGIDRTGQEFLYRIGGLENLFNYIRKLPSHKVLDVGVGDGNASRVISEKPISKGLDIEVAALRNSNELRKNFSKDKIHITTIETLKGIPNESLAGVLGMHSMGYSDQPLLAVKRLNQVLVPGGVIKATFHILDEEEEHNGTFFRDPSKFIEGFSALAYDVAYMDNFSWTGNDQSRIQSRLLNSIFLAIKPGNHEAPSANELLSLDFESIKSEAKDNLFGHPVFDINDY